MGLGFPPSPSSPLKQGTDARVDLMPPLPRKFGGERKQERLSPRQLLSWSWDVNIIILNIMYFRITKAVPGPSPGIPHPSRPTLDSYQDNAFTPNSQPPDCPVTFLRRPSPAVLARLRVLSADSPCTGTQPSGGSLGSPQDPWPLCMPSARPLEGHQVHGL